MDQMPPARQPPKAHGLVGAPADQCLAVGGKDKCRDGTDVALEQRAATSAGHGPYGQVRPWALTFLALA